MTNQLAKLKEQLELEIKEFKEWGQWNLTIPPRYMGVEEFNVRKDLYEASVDAAEEGLKQMGLVTTTEVQKTLNTFKQFRKDFEGEFDQRLRLLERRQSTSPSTKKAIKCSQNAMHYLTNVEMTIDSKEARLSQAVQDFFIAKMVPYNDKTSLEDQKSDLEKASEVLSNVLVELYGPRSKTVFDEIKKFLGTVVIIPQTSTSTKASSPIAPATSPHQPASSTTSSSSPRSVPRTPTPDVDADFNLEVEVETTSTEDVIAPSAAVASPTSTRNPSAATVPAKEAPATSDAAKDLKGAEKDKVKPTKGKKRTITDILKSVGTSKKKKSTATLLDPKESNDEEKHLSPPALAYMKKKMKEATSKAFSKPPSPALDDDDKDISSGSDSGDDKTFKPTKKDMKEADKDSSDDFISKTPPTKKTKVSSKSKADKPVPAAKKTKDSASSKKDPSTKETDDDSLPKRKRGPNKKPIALGIDYAADPTYLLAQPIPKKSGEVLSWEEVHELVNDETLVHGGVNSYFNPNERDIYVIRDFVCTPENLKDFVHRDNLVQKMVARQPKDDNSRYKYAVRKTGDKDYTSQDHKKYIYSIPSKSTLVIQYIGDVTQLDKHQIESDADVSTGNADDPKTSVAKVRKYKERLHKGTVDTVTDVDDLGEEEYRERLERMEARKNEKRRNALSNYLRTLRGVTPLSPPQASTEPVIQSNASIDDIAMVGSKMSARREAEEAVILDDEESPLTHDEIQSIIDKAIEIGEGIEDANSTFISVPEGGKLYLFRCENMTRPWNKVLLNDSYRYVNKKHDYPPDYRFDKAKWYGKDQNNKQTAKFKRYTYYNSDKKLLAIHYRGNVNMLGRPSHGNCRRATHAHIPTSKSLMDDITAMPKGTSAIQGHDKLTASLPGGIANAVLATRGPSAVKYLMKKRDMENIIKNTEEFKAMNIASDYTTPFCRATQTRPHFQALFATDKALDEMKKVLANMPDDEYLILHCDTTFEYGNFFITHISYRHPFLQVSETRPDFPCDMPIVPLFYCIHEKKFIDTHKWLFNRMEHIFTNRYPAARKNFKDAKKVLVSDKEFNGHQLWNNCETVHCWVHLRKNIDFQGKNKHCSPEQLEQLDKDFYAMIRSSSQESYIKRRDEMMQLPHWRNTGMGQYWMKEVDNDLLNYSGRWILNDLGVGHDLQGLTNNPAEALNSSIAKLTNKNINKRRTAAAGVLELYHYAQNRDKDIEAAYYGATNRIQVHKDFQFLKKPPTHAPSIYIEDPDTMMANITHLLDKPHDEQKQESPTKKIRISVDDEKVLEECAQLLVDNGRVFDIPNQDNYFGVRCMVTEENFFVDYLKDHCTCPVGKKEPCPHKLAVKLRYGLDDPDVKKKFPAKGHPLAFDPIIGKVPVYGTKKPTRDDKYTSSLHGVKKKGKKVISKRDQEIKDKYLAALRIVKSTQAADAAAAPTTAPDPTATTATSVQQTTPLPFQEVVMPDTKHKLTLEELAVTEDNCKIFMCNGTEKFAIYRPSPNRVMVYYKPKEERRIKEPSMISQFAISARTDATYELCNKNKPLIHIDLKALEPNKDFKQYIQTFHAKPFHEKMKIFKPDVKVELGCHCRMPINGREVAIVSCNVCKATYHNACLKGDESARAIDKKTFQCDCCRIPRNVEWSVGKQRNTCTIDNVFQGVYLATVNNKNLLDNFPKDEGHTALAECIRKVAKNNCAEAHQIWYDHTQKNNRGALTNPTIPNDFYGSTEDVAFDTIKHGGKFVYKGNCNYASCHSPYHVKDNKNWFVLRGLQGTLSEQIQRYVAPRQTSCNRCNVGMVQWEGLGFETQDNPWMIKFNHTGARSTKNEEFYDLPQTLTIADEKGEEHIFKLQTAILNINDNHYVSLQNYKEKWILYDGMGEMRGNTFPRRFRAPLPSDTDPIGPNKTLLSSIVYIRQFK